MPLHPVLTKLLGMVISGTKDARRQIHIHLRAGIRIAGEFFMPVAALRLGRGGETVDRAREASS